MPFDSQIRLRQLHNPELSGFILSILNQYLVTGSGASVNTGSLTGAFYPLYNNPSGYLNSIATGGLVDKTYLSLSNANLLALVDTLYYPRSNPSGYGAGSGITYNTGQFASIIDPYHNTGFGLINPLQANTCSLHYSNTGFYLENNAAGRRYVDVHNYRTSGIDFFDGEVYARTTFAIKPTGPTTSSRYPLFYQDQGGKVVFLIQSQTNTGLFYDVTQGTINASGISGWGITGTNAFALLSKTSTGFKYWDGKEFYLSGSGTKIDFYKRIITGFSISGYAKISELLGASGVLEGYLDNLNVNINELSGDAVLKSDLILTDESGQYSLKWGYNTRTLLNQDNAETLDWQNKKLIGLDGQATVDWKQMWLRTDDPPLIKVDWQNGILSGNWNAENLTINGQLIMTGSMNQFLTESSGNNLYYSISNPSNFTTASYVNNGFAPKSDYVSKTSLSQNDSLALTDFSYNPFNFKAGNQFFLQSPSGKSRIDFYKSSITGFSGNFTALTINGKAVSTGAGGTGSVDPSLFVKHGVTTANTQVMFNGSNQTALDFQQGDHFYLRDNGDDGYLIDVYGGEVNNFSISSSGFLGFLSSVAEDYTFFANDLGVYMYAPDFSAAIDLESKFIAGLTIQSSDIKVNSLPVLTQIVNTGAGSGIYHSTDGFNTAYLKSLVRGNGINISGSGNSLVLSVTGVGGTSTGFLLYLTGTNPTIIDNYPLTSGLSSMFVPFTNSFTGSPYVLGSLMNTGTEPLVPFIISGTRTSGFFVDFGDPLPGNKYSFTYIATTQLGLLAVSSGNNGTSSSTLTLNRKTSNYTLSVSDDVILADSSSSLVRLSLPVASTVSGKLFRMKRVNSGVNNVVISGAFIDGETGISLVSQYQSLSVLSDGSGYYVF